MRTPLIGLDLSSGARARSPLFWRRRLARQFVDRNVTINHILPGVFDTDRIATATGRMAATEGRRRRKSSEAARAEHPRQSAFGTADEFGRLCAFLASAHAGYITGQSLPDRRRRLQHGDLIFTMKIAQGVAKGVLMRVGSALAFSMMATVAKLTHGYPIGQIVFLPLAVRARRAGLLAAFAQRVPHAIRTHRPLGHLGAQGLQGMRHVLVFSRRRAAAAALTLTAIGYLAPLLVVALAASRTRQRDRCAPIAGPPSSVGFLGVIVMVGEHLGQGSGSRLGALAAVSCAAFAAMATIQTRRLARSAEYTGAIVFYFLRPHDDLRLHC